MQKKQDSGFGYDGTFGGYLEDSFGSFENYNNWILAKFKPFISGNILEVGAGMGNLSLEIATKLLEKNQTLFALEPSTHLFEKLRTILQKDNNKITGQNIQIINSALGKSLEDLKTKKIENIVYINVLEHIENDIQELRTCFDLLESNGKIFIFAPALETLYSPRDYRVGHFRRYYKNELFRKLEISGFKVLKLEYMDTVGAILWFVKFKVLKLDSISTNQVKFFDKTIVPTSKIIDKINPFFGKNIIAIAQKL